MKILLINPPEINIIPANTPEMVDKQRGKLPPLGLLYLAAYLEKYTNHQIKVIDCPTEETTYQQLEEAIKQENPDIVGVTIITFTLIDVLKTLKIVKKVNPEIKTIVGGPHVHIYPEETLGFPEVDFAILGEGEIPIKNLVDNINKTKNRKIKLLLIIKMK